MNGRVINAKQMVKSNKTKCAPQPTRKKSVNCCLRGKSKHNTNNIRIIKTGNERIKTTVLYLLEKLVNFLLLY